jgi:hypothetical protein
VRKAPSWPRNLGQLQSFIAVLPQGSIGANLHLLGQPNTFLASGLFLAASACGRPPRLLCHIATQARGCALR